MNSRRYFPAVLCQARLSWRGVIGGAMLLALTAGFAAAQDLPAGLTAEQLMKLQQTQQGNAARTIQPGVSPQTTVIDAAQPGRQQTNGYRQPNGYRQTDGNRTNDRTRATNGFKSSDEYGTTDARGSTDALKPPPPSKLESILSERSGAKLQQFGYDQLGDGRSITLSQVGGVQDDYVLGPGDEIVVSLRGQENAEYRATVDRDGRVVLPRMSPVAAGGRSFGEFRKDMLATVHRAYVSTEGYISVGQMRQITVLVSGEVNIAGAQTLTGLSTVADAILLAGGVKKTGSLRNVKIQRGGRTISVDLYAMLVDMAHGKLATLASGDRIVVPPIGATLAVAGDVRRSAIFELPAGQRAMSLREAMALAGGTVAAGKYAVSLMRMKADGSRDFVDVTGQNPPVRDGEIVSVKATVNIAFNQVTLQGAVRAPGTFALGKYATLHDLIPSQEALRPGAYMLFGFIDRTNPKTLQHMLLPFSPLRVVQQRENMDLQSDDVVRVLDGKGIAKLLDMVLRKEAADKEDAQDDPEGTKSETEMRRRKALALKEDVSTSDNAEDTTADQTGINSKLGEGEMDASALTDASGYVSAHNTFFGRALADYRVTLNGAVHRAGIYLVAPGTTLAELLVVANGLTDNADLSSYEITSTVIDNLTGTETTTRNYYPASPTELANRVLMSKDDVIFHYTFSDRQSGTVTIKGEVKYPGSYTVLRGEKLSSLLKRAGGLTDSAFPDGTIYQRKSLIQTERLANERTAKQVEDQLMLAITRIGKESQMDPSAFTTLQSYVTLLREQPALGRMVVIADIDALTAHPESDPVLEDGDSITIPVRPYAVSVMGEVLQPNSVPYRAGATASDYIQQAGGLTQMADDSEIFVVRPDGTAYRARSSWFDFLGSDVPIGSTIFVGRDISSYNIRQVVLDMTAIFSQLATTAAALAVLAKQ